MNNKRLIITGTILISCLVITGTILMAIFGIKSFSDGHQGWGFCYTLFLTVIIPFAIIGMLSCAWNGNQHHNGKDKTKEELEEEYSQIEAARKHDIELKKLEQKNNER
jgi:flagellar biosynthesis protein FlhB